MASNLSDIKVAKNLSTHRSQNYIHAHMDCKSIKPQKEVIPSSLCTRIFEQIIEQQLEKERITAKPQRKAIAIKNIELDHEGNEMFAEHEPTGQTEDANILETLREAHQTTQLS